MNILIKIKIKLNSLMSFYFFQYWGLPGIKNEHISKSVLRKYLKQNPVIIDCGAHDGADSVELCRILGGHIHAFEPVTDIFNRLKKRTSPYSSITCYNLALSNTSGVQHFHVSEGQSDASSSLLAPKDHLTDHPGTVFNKTIEVQALTLDDWASMHNVKKVDMLWLDMQGFELQMLQASSTILGGVSVIHTEVSTKQTYEGVTLYKDYKAFLESKGFSAVIEAIPTGWDMGNVLFVRKDK